jgi:D-alanyl-D-alanine carboxypeptidase/D-alanyl-D-alanine-endopeptidase (penicillin-binding protein 4)
VTRPTALAFDENLGAGPPERAAAASLTRSLRLDGVAVDGKPGSGAEPEGMTTLGLVRSAPLRDILERQNHGSINFDAEMITKALGAEQNGRPGSTASGASAIERWVAAQGVHADVRDGSGLSHDDRISTTGIVTLLLEAERRAWGDALRASLPAPGEGSLAGRLAGVPVRAKTGTLFVTPASALSGYVRSAGGRRVAFSVISRGLDKSTAVGVEDAIARILAGAMV